MESLNNFPAINPFSIEERKRQFIIGYFGLYPNWPIDKIVMQAEQHLYSELELEKKTTTLPN